MTINQLRYVLKVYESKSYTKAAEELYITQPALSDQIKKLEKELGFEIFNRLRSGITVTPIGYRFIQSAYKVVDKFVSLEKDVSNYKSRISGVLKIGLLWSFGYTRIPHYIQCFSKEYPGINIEYTVNGSRVLLDKLLNNDLHMIFVIGTGEISNDESLNSSLVSSSDIVACINEKNPLAHKKTIDFSDLSGEKLMVPSSNSNIYDDFMKYINMFSKDINIISENSMMDINYKIAKYNLAISFMSKEAFDFFESDNKNPTVNRVNLVPKISRSIHLVSKKSLEKDPLIDRFTQYLNSLYYTELNK